MRPATRVFPDAGEPASASPSFSGWRFKTTPATSFMRLDRCVDGEGQRVVCVSGCAHRRLIPPTQANASQTRQSRTSRRVPICSGD